MKPTHKNYCGKCVYVTSIFLPTGDGIWDAYVCEALPSLLSVILRKGEGDGDYWSMPVISINPGRVYVDFNKKNPLTGLSAYDILAAFVFRMYKSQKSAQPKNQLSDVELA